MSVACGITWLGDVPRLFGLDDCTAVVRSSYLNRNPGGGLRPLSAFFSISPEQAREDYESYTGCSADELPHDSFPPEEWFPAAEGLATVRAHLAHLAAHPNEASKTPMLDDDLRDMERVLAALDAARAPFHFYFIA